MNVQRLIEKYKELYENVFDFGAKLACQLILQDLEQLDELETGHADEAPRYLKNILARLRELPDHDREVWLKAIMGEFKEDFSHVKWREGYEQGKFEGEWVGNQLKDADKVRRELNQVRVPQFVADFIAEQKKLGHTLSYSIDASMSDRVAEWYWDNSELFALAWIFGYEVEKEKRYEVILCNGQSLKTVYRQGSDHLDFEMVYGDLESFTRKQLEEAGFGWVFSNSYGFCCVPCGYEYYGIER